MTKELFTRYKNNPILTPDDFPDSWSVNSVFNPGVGDRDGKTFIFPRVENLERISGIVGFYSEDGITDWVIDESTIFTGDEAGYGVEDARLTWMPTLRKWAIVYTNYSKGGYLVSIALTDRDFKEYTYLGNVLPPANKDATLFPEPIGGYWWLIHRPTIGENKQVWICKSRCIDEQDESALSQWGGHSLLLSTDGTPRWDGTHVGVNGQPIKTDYGWLISYHGMKNKKYCFGLAMLALDNPAIVTHRTKEFVMSPHWGKTIPGDVRGAIFSCGWRVHHDGDARILRLYYGEEDSVICLAEASLGDVIYRVLQDPV